MRELVLSLLQIDFAAGSNNPSFLSDGGVSWHALTASSGTLTLAPVTAGLAINVAGSGGYAISDSTLDGIANEFTKVTIGNSPAGSVSIGAGEALNTTDAVGGARTWDLEIIGGASGSFVVGTSNTVTLGTNQALILDSASVNITQTNQILGGGELELKGAGDVTLTNASNNLSILKASNSGNLNYRDTDAIDLGTITVAALTVNAGGALTDSGSLAITGLADLTGSTITINDSFDAGSLTFNSAGAVVVAEDSATALSGTSTALSLDLDSTGAITDDGTADVTVTNLADFAGTSVTVDATDT